MSMEYGLFGYEPFYEPFKKYWRKTKETIEFSLNNLSFRKTPLFPQANLMHRETALAMITPAGDFGLHPYGDTSKAFPVAIRA